MISIYSSAFNLLKNNFDFEDSVRNFTSFADEVVVCVNTSEDDTYRVLTQLSKDGGGKLRVIESSFSYDDPSLDGKIKNEALQNTTHEMKIGLDMDERIPVRHKNKWIDLFDEMSYFPHKAVMIPSLNLWGSRETIKGDPIEHRNSLKWYLHKGGLFRGPVNFARRSDGTIDTSKSDTCELIDDRGNLVQTKRYIWPEISTMEEYLDAIENKGTFIYHLGYESFENRVDRNQNFWYKHWRTESGGESPKHKVHMNTNEFSGKVIEHNLKYWNDE